MYCESIRCQNLDTIGVVYMAYLQAERDYLIDTSTYKFVPVAERNRNEDVGVIDHLWNAVNLWKSYYISESSADKHLRRVNILELNDTTFIYGRNYSSGRVRFFDPIQKDEMLIEINLSVELNSGYMSGVNYVIRTNGQPKPYRTRIMTPSVTPQFNQIKRLATEEVDYEFFSFGLLADQFEIVYRGKTLSGKSYACLSGPWGILLDDSLRFDSLVLLERVVAGALFVDQFVYTVNPYVMRAKVLYK